MENRTGLQPRTASALLLALTLLPCAAPAQTLHLSYAVSLLGLRVARAEIWLRQNPAHYAIHAEIQTVGPAALSLHGHSIADSDGAFAPAGIAALHAATTGQWNGHRRRIALHFAHGVPVIDDLEPNDPNRRAELARDAVPDSADALGLAVTVAHRLQTGLGCRLDAHLVDGRGVATIRITPAIRAPLRCDFTTSKLRGAAAAKHAGHGFALFTPATAALPMLPVRIVLGTGPAAPELRLLAARQDPNAAGPSFSEK